MGSVAFAGITGSVDTSFGLNLDNGDYGIVNDTEFEINLVLHEDLGEAKGGGDVYAEIAASLTFAFDEDTAGIPPTVEVDFDYAKIVSGDWSVSILGAVDGPNFASSAIDTYAEDETVSGDGLWEEDDAVDVIRKIGKIGGGLAVSYMDYQVSLAMPYGDTDTTGDNNYDAEKYNIFASVLTPDIELADGLTVAFGAAGLLNNAGKKFGASAKADYEVDELALSFATDAVVKGEDFNVEVALGAVYDFVAVDAYYAKDALVGDGTEPVENLLSVKAAATIDAFKVVVTGKDLVNAQALGLSVDWDATDELTANVNGGYTIASKAYYAGAGVTYKVDEFTAALKGKYSDNVDASDAKLEMEASIESKALVDGANLYAKWKSGNLLDSKIGKFTVGAKIEF
ncbi:MAG: hypothetical protein WCY81_05215 [Sphaerochaetaceae bacterium]